MNTIGKRLVPDDFISSQTGKFSRLKIDSHKSPSSCTDTSSSGSSNQYLFDPYGAFSSSSMSPSLTEEKMDPIRAKEKMDPIRAKEKMERIRAKLKFWSGRNQAEFKEEKEEKDFFSSTTTNKRIQKSPVQSRRSFMKEMVSRGMPRHFMDLSDSEISMILSKERLAKIKIGNVTKAMDNGSPIDNTDTHGIIGKIKPQLASAEISGSLESEDYYMNYPKRGKCYIFNHHTFEPHTGLNVRNETDADAAHLYRCFKELQFDVTLHQDLKVKEVDEELQKAGKENHKDYSCFVCCILSHGKDGNLYAADGQYKTNLIFSPFRGDVCPSLVGKPKMFFIQACQGDMLDCGVNVTYKESTDSGGDEKRFGIPTEPDFLIMYSTVPGFYSWSNTSSGSWFIQSLCATLQKYAHDKDLIQLLAMVNRRFACDYESFTPRHMHLKKQVPLVTSTLTRSVRFPAV